MKIILTKNIMKTLKCVRLALAILVCSSCTNKYEEFESTDEFVRESYVKYIEYSERPIVSILDLALGNIPLSRSENCILGFTEKDVNYLNSLNENELLDLNIRLMNKWGFESNEDIEAVLNQAYDEICKNMSTEEFVKFNEFITKYIEMPSGITSLENLNVFQSDPISSSFNNTCVYAAIGIDNFGRMLYTSKYNSPVSEEKCRKNFAIRITITSIGTMAGMIIPGPGWAVAAAAICDAISAAADYANCLKHIEKTHT